MDTTEGPSITVGSLTVATWVNIYGTGRTIRDSNDQTRKSMPGETWLMEYLSVYVNGTDNLRRVPCLERGRAQQVGAHRNTSMALGLGT